jgi:hypothetical protein
VKVLGIDGAFSVFSAARLDTDDPGRARTAVAHGGDALERGMWTIEEVLGPDGLTGIDRIAVGLGPPSRTPRGSPSRLTCRSSASPRTTLWSRLGRLCRF